jgi:predicted RNase H-like nuclease (RuvC/YqgF family)
MTSWNSSKMGVITIKTTSTAILAAQHESLKRKTEAINKARKTEQLQAGERLYNLESKWQQLVYNNREIETACEALQRDVKRLKGAAESTDMESS